MANPVHGDKRIITKLYPFPYRKFGQTVQGEVQIEQEYRVFKTIGFNGSKIQDGAWVDIRIVE